MTVATAQAYRHHYVCKCGHRHEHRTETPRPTDMERWCRRCGFKFVPYRYTNFPGDAKHVVRATYAAAEPPKPDPVNLNDLGAPAYTHTVVPVRTPSGWAGRTYPPTPSYMRQRAGQWTPGPIEGELKHALNLLDEVMSYDKGMREEEWVSFCNAALPYMKAHGRQKYTAGWS